jgi:hypothetical protein
MEPITEATIASDQGTFGQLTRKSWSCLVLDTADRLAPMIGGPAFELYYRIAQEMEAAQTGYGGAEESKIRQIFEDRYVSHSQRLYRELYWRIVKWEL